MTYSTGLVDIDTPVFAVGHDCQVADVDVEVRDFDTAIDYIVTNLLLCFCCAMTAKKGSPMKSKLIEEPFII